jgi:curved DNA-binding protein CbpA
LIEEGIRGMKYDPALKAFLADKTPFSKSIDLYLRLNEGERELYEKIKGDSTSEELLESFPMNPELFWKSLYLLYCLDLVDLKTSRTEESPSPPKKEKPETGLSEEEKLAEVVTFHQTLENATYYQILDVASDATLDDLKRSYFRLARKFHPDLFSRDLPAETTQKIDMVFDHITKAYQTLSDEKGKGDYDKQLESPQANEGKNLAKEGEKRFRQGKTLFDQARYEEALVFLEQAIRLSRDKAKYFQLLAMTQTRLPIYRKEAEKNFIRATKLEPWNAEAYVGLGVLYRKEGLHIKAKKQFQKALQIDPDHKIALREMSDKGRDKGKTSLKDMQFKDLLKMDLFGKKKK